jgi:peptidoglycan/xylan/chitin deacetylase (PgdA/CDA1 family)
VTLVSHGDGTTAVRDYSLVDVTREGPLRWDRPMVSLTFDDGWQSVYDRGLPLLDKHGYRGTFYIPPGLIETPQYMTGEELQELRQGGHEIAAHSYSHPDLTTLSASRLDDELRRSQEALAQAGFSTRDMATPLGRSDPQVDWYANKYYDTVRGTQDGINTRQNLDRRNLKVFYVDYRTTPEHLAKALAETASSNGWLILVYHRISAPGAGSPQQSTVPREVFAAELDQIQASGIAVEPVSTALAQLEKK